MFGGTKKRVSELESEISRQKEEIAGYREEVEAHFKKTAGLFVSMAGTYKDLFEHLSTGYERLSERSARELFKDRVGALLIGGATGKTFGEDKVSAYAAEGMDQQNAIVGAASDANIEVEDGEQDSVDTSREKPFAKAHEEINESDEVLKKTPTIEPETSSLEVTDKPDANGEGTSPTSAQTEASQPESEDLNQVNAREMPDPGEGIKTKPN
jgi:hypothetical protein